MPFAKRSTYTLTLAISAALVSSYAVAENAPSEQEMAWSCSMTKDGEWNCEVNEALVEQVESQTATNTSSSPAQSTEQGTAQTTAPQPEPVQVQSTSPARPAPVRTVNNAPQSERTTPQSAPTPASTASASSSTPDTWDCVAGADGTWDCNNGSTANRSSATSPARTAATTASTPTAGTAYASNQPVATSEVIGSEWQCSTGSNGDWDCHKVNIHALAVPGSRAGSTGQSAPQYITENPYSHLDWAFYRDPTGQQCVGRYVEPQFPLHGDEHLADPPMYLEADQSSTIIGGLTQLQGGVSMRQGDRRLSASSAELDQVTNKARLEGNVRFRQPGLLLLGDNAQIDTNTSEAIFSNAQFVSHGDNLRGRAERILRLEDERLRLEQGDYTYCPPNSEAWMLSADTIVLNKAEGFGEAEDAVLRVGGVPIFYTPYFTFPIDDTRRSGFLYPSLGYSEEEGLDISVPYYFNIAPNMDDTLTARYISERGLLLENEFRYMNDWSTSVLSAAYLPNDDKFNDDRWLIGLDHTGSFASYWQTYIDYTEVSDIDYFDDLDTNLLEVSREDHLDQRLDLSYRRNNLHVLARVHDYQTIDGTAPYTKLPQLTLTNSHSLGENTQFKYEAEHTRFDRDITGLTGRNRTTGDRTFLQPRLEHLWQAPWATVESAVSLWSSSYSLDDQVNGWDDSPSVFAPIFSVDGTLYLDRALENGGTHTLEPRLFALYVPEEDQDAIPDFDTSLYTFNYDALFRENRFSGHDRIGDAQQISLGVTTRYITEKGFEKGSFQIGQAYYFADREVQLSPTAAAETTGHSDLATLGTWYLTPNLRTYLDTVLDASDFKTRTSTLGLKYNADVDHVVDVRYRYTDNSSEQTYLSLIWPLAQNWTSMARIHYDTKGNETEELALGLEYESCCWKVSMAGRRWLDGLELDGSNKYDTGIFLQLTLKGLGSFGSGSSSFLDDIIGYEEREEYYDN